MFYNNVDRSTIRVNITRFMWWEFRLSSRATKSGLLAEQDARETTEEKGQRLKVSRPCGNAFVTDNRVTLVLKELPAREERDWENIKVAREITTFLLPLSFVLGNFLLFKRKIANNCIAFCD